ncbi:hypothetical protein GUITHDRAFT_101559 [Guillardia theta CCMP2712]|uniref:Uncharacterized protein n=1 Tax=Guillardia theta (strain CCMP2712) TaxID=905079 RepID=L1JY28_GUITC|nr:hypothetical protein GUITHDRAFT_101559 [Guillardia theta CCMP2712]EKX53120.1 hypothetical protein GUITHDRAFT_101559 [Guillardia theta CCMP2712]|eukprot:XP_005840100.1 hypothetical protein GUITHDRAFT_101559 [Guillardia theta CCMP2712]
MWALKKALECLPCPRKINAAKKSDSTPRDSSLESLEAGAHWDHFDDWDSKPTNTGPPPVLQRLEDFDGMAPMEQKETREEPDFFGQLGLQPNYQPPKKIDVTPKASALKMSLSMDEDIDIEGWEAGNAKKPKKKLAAVRMS